MATVETKEIGIALGVDKGSYIKTEYVKGKIQLKKITGSESNFEKEGYWESEIIDIAGKFKEYDKLAVTKTQFTKDLYLIETRTSDNGVDFDPYIALSAGGSILSTKRKYIQIKITFFAGYVEENVNVDDFDSEESQGNWDSEFITVEDGNLKLKENYTYEMTKDATWTQEGTLFRQPIQNTKFKKINSLNIE
ncbi:hypothetical protein [Sporosarcina sp. FSL W7-1283]|uniref:hypothetical protein n=1 Tax=Sporosarcina sp. FSL W7-1283 TaxID=2921560 RepID=UPI0030FC8C92